nr:retrotransposon protein, putative, Ty1-copia subclass [Tanacetum cinerariifolium]
MKVQDDEVGDLGEPANYKTVMLDPDKVIWQGAMDEEMQFMKVNKGWIVVDRPPNAKVVRNKWLYKKKTDMDGKVHTYKARLVAKGCTQTFGIDYQETFSPVADIRSIRILIAIAAYYDYEVWQMDFKTAFFNGCLDKDIYIEQPEGLKEVKDYLGKCFSVNDLGEAAYILGIKIYRDRSSRLIGLNQSAYINKILNKFNMQNSKKGFIPMEVKYDLNTSLNHEEDDLEIDEPQSDIVPIRRSTRTRHAPDRMCLYIDVEEHELGDLGEPANYKAALLDPESEKWLNAMNVEMQSMKDNEVWVLVELPHNGKTVGSKWLFKKKTDMDGNVHIYKARLVAKGFTQTLGIDYEETFSPVADIIAIRILIAIAAYYDYEIWQMDMDVKTAFLNGYLNEEVYMEQPEGFVNPKYPNRVCKLKRSIYGLKQASRQWNKRFDDENKKFGFTQSRDEPCVYIKASGSNITFLILYVNDILLMGNSIPMLQSVKTYLGKCFAMKDLGEAAYILRIKIYRDRSKRLIGLCQSAYIEKILKRYSMENSKRGSIPMQEKLKLSKSQATMQRSMKEMANKITALSLQNQQIGNRRPQVNHSRLAKIKFPKFFGDDVKGWVFRCEPFFLIEQTPDVEKVTLISIYLYDKALLWHSQLVRTLGNNKYETTAREYEEAFDNLLSRVEVSEDHAVSLFMGGSSTPPSYSPGALTPQSYSPGTLRNAECSNCKHLLDKITVLEATIDMYTHPEQDIVSSAALFHEVYNSMGKLDLE